MALLETNQDRIVEFGVRRLGLFGSFVHKQQRADSDIDLLVEFSPGHETYNNLLDLHDFLQKLFDRQIELVTIKSLSPYIGPHILREVEYVALHN
jgi:predicted nucleotidyltransferase